MGAPWPVDPEEQGGASPIERIDEIQNSHWALQPIRQPEIPQVQNTAWPNNGIDFFILAQQEANGLSPSPRASSRQLLRRASFDMLGLPPTAEERDRFFDSDGEIDWHIFVDHLLDRPEYGQRWGAALVRCGPLRRYKRIHRRRKTGRGDMRMVGRIATTWYVR